MKILLSSRAFHPSVGGLEECSALLAEEFVRAGHQVTLVTQTPSADPGRWPFDVVRRPSPGRLLGLTRWCDVFLHNNISLRAAWPLILAPRPWVVAHHTWIARPDGRRAWQDALKLLALRSARSISVSRAVAQSLPVRSTVIGNPYRDETFRLAAVDSRALDLVFLGRLVSDKGADLLIEALGLLKARGRTPRLTIVGSGPEELPLRRAAERIGVSGQIEFAGVKRGPELAAVLNRHKILVVPSRWEEPFGIVALEGIACGCVVVGSAGGGLAEAIGPCGATFPNGDGAALAAALERLLADPRVLCGYRVGAKSHLSAFQKASAARAYLAVLEDAAR